MKIYTTKTGADALGITQRTLRQYAGKFNVGSQPGGVGTPHYFTIDEILKIRNRGKYTYKHERVEEKEDRVELGLGSLYDPDLRPRS